MRWQISFLLSSKNYQPVHPCWRHDTHDILMPQWLSSMMCCDFPRYWYHPGNPLWDIFTFSNHLMCFFLWELFGGFEKTPENDPPRCFSISPPKSLFDSMIFLFPKGGVRTNRSLGGMLVVLWCSSLEIFLLCLFFFGSLFVATSLHSIALRIQDYPEISWGWDWNP